MTFYAAYDNDPAGSTEIAYPQLHDEAGGLGTHADPLTFATHRDEIAPGTRIYVPTVRKYFLMEDSCEACENEWEADRTRHIDLWAGAATDAGVLACEEALTPPGPVTVELDPPPGRPVDTTPFYEDGRCLGS